jgi:hypothetical protein
MPIKISRREESGKVAQASGLSSNYFSRAGRLCHSEAMTRTEKLLAELIALPSVNPAFLSPEVGTARRAVRWEAELPPDARAARPYQRMRGEGGIHTGQRDEFGQKFFHARHGFRVAQACSL